MTIGSLVRVLMGGFTQISLLDLVDILIVAILLYKLVGWTKQTQAYGVLKGVAIMFLLSILSQQLGLTVLSWVLDSFVSSGSIIIIVCILFQPEISRILDRLGGSGRRIGNALRDTEKLNIEEMIRGLEASILSMARRRVGALIVVEQKTGLEDIIDTGTRIDGVLSGALVENIFEPNTPLHDGAVIVRGTSIVAAACFLPLSTDPTVARELGTRHRAALGISTVSDSVTIVVSEETGSITIARDGKLTRYVDRKTLHDTLNALFLPSGGPAPLLGGLFARRKERA